jgi:transcription elongation factor GreA
MIMAGYNYLTKDGYEKIKSELEELKTSGRKEVARAIAEAREKGDLSENAEYDAAKDAQGMLELKINELEKVLANARVLDTNDLDNSKVTVLANVTIKNVKTKKEITYKLVNESEADLKEKKISVSSPIGQGLLGKSVGDIAVVDTPAGSIEFEVMSINF